MPQPERDAMFANERRNYIKKLILQNKKIEVFRLSTQLGVSEVTIRKDLEYLENTGFLIRTHGGAVLNEAFVKTMLKNAGLKEDDAELIDVGFELMSSMTTGQVDATIGGFVSHEVPELENQGFTVNYIKPTENGVPDYTELVFVTSMENAEKNADKLTRFLRATKKGYEDVKANPEKGVENLLKNQNTENFPLNKDVETKSVATILSLAEKDGAPFLSQSEETWTNNIKWMLDTGIITKSVDAKDMIVKLVD